MGIPGDVFSLLYHQRGGGCPAHGGDRPDGAARSAANRQYAVSVAHRFLYVDTFRGTL